MSQLFWSFKIIFYYVQEKLYSSLVPFHLFLKHLQYIDQKSLKHWGLCSYIYLPIQPDKYTTSTINYTLAYFCFISTLLVPIIYQGFSFNQVTVGNSFMLQFCILSQVDTLQGLNGILGNLLKRKQSFWQTQILGTTNGQV